MPAHSQMQCFVGEHLVVQAQQGELVLPMLKTPRMLSSIVLWQGSPAVFPVCRQQHWLTTGRATCKLMQPLLLLASLAFLALKALTVTNTLIG